MGGKWKLAGYDAFASEYYKLGDFSVVDGRSTIDGMKPEYDTREEALADAYKRLDYLEETQPTATSGGQGDLGTQDRVFIIHPDGIRERVIKLPVAAPGPGSREKFWRLM